MIEVTPKAALAVADYCQDKDTLPIRIFLKIGGCGIRSFGLALEAAQPSDKLFDIDGLIYIIDPNPTFCERFPNTPVTPVFQFN